MTITADQLQQIMPQAHAADIANICDSFNAAMDEFGISTPAQQAAYVAQVAVESDQFFHLRGTKPWGEEYASGAAYEFRQDLGNTEAGDGVRYKGRGLIQTTGKVNYGKVSTALGVDYVANPTWLARYEDACRSAGYYWQSHSLNDLADKGWFITITKKVNGGTSGLSARQAFWAKAKAVLGV